MLVANTLVRTLLVDDNPEFLDAAARFLATDSRIKIVGYALSGSEAVEEAMRLSFLAAR